MKFLLYLTAGIIVIPTGILLFSAFAKMVRVAREEEQYFDRDESIKECSLACCLTALLGLVIQVWP